MKKSISSPKISMSPAIPSVSCQADSAPITVGQKLWLKCQLSEGVNAQGAPAANSTVPEFKNNDETAKYDLVFLGKLELKNGVLQQEVTSYKVGSHEISKVVLIYNGHTSSVVPFKIEVKSVIPPQEEKQENPKPFPIVDPMKLSAPWWWWALWGGLVLVLCVYAGIKIAKLLAERRRLATEAASPQKKLTSQEKFILALQKLESHGWHSQGEYKKFALELTVILKKAMGEKFKFPAEDMTTEEFFETLARKQPAFWREMEKTIAGVFENLDQIKFAKIETTMENCQSLIDQSRKTGTALYRGEP